MKLIYAGTGEASLDPTKWLFNCKRNAACQRPYFVPYPHLSDIVFYLDLPFGKPDSTTVEIIDTCGKQSGGDFNDDFNDDFFNDDIAPPPPYTAIPATYVIAQKPDGSWYGVFANLSTTVGEGSFPCFYLRITCIKDGITYTFYSQQICLQRCEELTLLQGCYPNEPVGANATDCNGIYYGFHAGNGVPVGATNYRYFHKAYVRLGSIIEQKNKLSFSAFNSRRMYKNFFSREWVFEFELVPTFYKDIIIGVLNRGNIKIDGVAYKLADEQTFEIIDTNSKLWGMDVLLDELCKQYFDCGEDNCTVQEICSGSPTDVTYERTDVPSHKFIFSGQVMNMGEVIEWEVYNNADNSLIDSGTLTGLPFEFELLDADFPDFDPENNCYKARWRKQCLTEEFTDYSQKLIGDCLDCTEDFDACSTVEDYYDNINYGKQHVHASNDPNQVLTSSCCVRVIVDMQSSLGTIINTGDKIGKIPAECLPTCPEGFYRPTQMVQVDGGSILKLDAAGYIIWNGPAFTLNVQGTDPLKPYPDADANIININADSCCVPVVIIPFVYEAPVRLGNVEGMVCMDTEVVVYSSAPIGPGVILYADNGLTTPITGYSFAALFGSKYVLDGGTGLLGANIGPC